MNQVKYFALVIVLFLNLFTILVMGLRINFLFELLVFILFLILSLIILWSVYTKKHYELFISLFFIVSLTNLFYIKSAFLATIHVNVGLRGWLLFGVTLFLNAISFLIFASSIEKKPIEKEEIIEKEIEPYVEQEPAEPEVLTTYPEVEKEIKPKVKKTFRPGKFIASNNSTFYHTVKCDWAKKISKNNRVWFKSKEEARKKGYKQHSCLRKK